MSEHPDDPDDTVAGAGAHPPTSHLPVAGELPPLTGEYPIPQPPRRTRGQAALVTASMVAIVAVVVAVVIIVVTKQDNGQAGQPTSAPPMSTAAAPSAATTTPGSATPAPPPSSTEGWHEVAATNASGLTYAVPKDWTDSQKTRSTGRGEQWGGVAEFGTYQCTRGTYTRGFVASGKAPTGDRTDLGMLAGGYAKSLATHWYENPQTQIGDPQPREVDGHDAVLVTLRLTVDPEDPRCDASAGEVVVLAVRLDRGVGVLAAVNDLQGGPSDPPCAPDGVVQQIFGTVKVR